jgi:hypothetical protein
MSAIKPQSFLGSAILFVLTVCQAFSHQLEVDRFQIQEIAPSTYEIRYDIPVGEIEKYGLPILPEAYAYREPISRHEGPQRLRFHTSGKALGYEDRIVLPWARNGVLATAVWRNGTSSRQFFKADDAGITIELHELSVSSGSALQTMRRYLTLGFEHILEGYDHLLFVVGLAMLVRGWRRLLLTVSAFTLAHSITLGLATAGILQINPVLVETLIALSIAFLSKEILLADRNCMTLASRWPWGISFSFGLIHGLGFAGALQELGMENDSILFALLAFNLGVEVGQVLFLMLWLAVTAVLLRFGLRQLSMLRPLLPYALGITAMYWFLERFFVDISNLGWLLIL